MTQPPPQGHPDPTQPENSTPPGYPTSPAYPDPGAYPASPAYPAPAGYPAAPQSPSAPQPATYGQPSTYGQPATYGQPSTYGQPGTYGQPATYGAPQPSYDATAGYPPPAYPYPAADPYQAAGYPALDGKPEVPGVNGLAITGFILSFCGPLLGLIFSIVALVQLRNRRQSGRGLAIAGVIISSCVILIGGVIAAIVIATSADRDGNGTITDRGSVDVFDLKVGDCLNGLKEDDEVTNLPGVPCAQPHEGEVFAIFDLTGSTYPGDSTVFSRAEDGCLSRLDDYSQKAADDESLELFYLHPTPQSWLRGDREVTCLVTDPDKNLVGSVKD